MSFFRKLDMFKINTDFLKYESSGSDIFSEGRDRNF